MSDLRSSGVPAAAARHEEIVYEDEHLRIEWSARSPAAAATVAVTFDPILVGPDQPAYAAHFLHRAGIDTLCVRKKQEHFYQPLSRERFDQATGPVLARYRRRLAYGSSLGAYAVLYFCRQGFEMVISSSPRVSAHPLFGRPYWQQRVPFLHEPFDAAQPATSGAVVFYDPHDTPDRRFVDEALRAGWPQARFVAVPYAGHPANQFLSEIGYIAPFVQAVVAGKLPPPLDRRGHKARSFSYRHVLALACLRRDEPNWAERLCRQALAMKPDLIAVKLTLGQALLALGRLDEADAVLREFQRKHPQDGDARHALQAVTRARLRRRFDRLLQAWRWLPGRLQLAVSREDIAWCYRHLLGREPESERAVQAHRHCPSFEHLVRAFVGSPEYVARIAGGPVSRTLEQRVHMVCTVRRLLPPGGRLVDVRPAGFFSPKVCTPAGDRPVALALNTASVPAGTVVASQVLQALGRTVQPGGHALLAVRGTLPVEGLHAAGFDLVRRLPARGNTAAQLVLGRRRPHPGLQSG